MGARLRPVEGDAITKASAARFTLALDPVEAGEQRATAAVVGAPYDATECFRPGAAGGPAAIRRMSDSLETYSRVLEADLEDVTIVDHGDVALDGVDIDEALERIEAAFAAALQASALAVMLGGEHTVSLAGYRAVKRVHPDAALVQIDAHADLRADWEGRAITHASWTHQAGVEFGFENVYQLGVRSLAREEWDAARLWVAWHNESLDFPDTVGAQLRGRPVYLTVDIDVLDPGAAPGTGCPEPGGVTFRELQHLLYVLGAFDVVAFDVVEVAPSLDSAEITAVAAAKLVREAILLFGAGRERR
jgi:agmatinase